LAGGEVPRDGLKVGVVTSGEKVGHGEFGDDEIDLGLALSSIYIYKNRLSDKASTRRTGKGRDSGAIYGLLVSLWMQALQ